MNPFFDPRSLPDGGRSLAHAVELCTALSLLDGDEPGRWQRCRSTALRYLEVVRAGRFPPHVALDLLRRAVETWAPSGLDPARRTQLDERVPFWVGTVYGLRWDGVTPSPATAAPARPASRLRAVPGPEQWAELQAWRAALAAQHARTQARREACRALLVERHARAVRLLAVATMRVEESRWMVASSAARRAAERVAGRTRGVGVVADVGTARDDGTGRLSDTAIFEVALRIRRALHAPRPGDVRDDILARRHELSPEDEARVEAALRALAEEER